MKSQEPYRILAVDDSADNCSIILNCFSEKYTVHVANSAESALSLLEKIVPDIILLDIIMPGMDGMELCSRIKSQDNLKHIPVLFLTVMADTDQIIAGFQAGAADYITKPFNLDELKARVEMHLELKSNRDLLLQRNMEQNELLHILHHDLANTFTSLSALAQFLQKESEQELPHLPKIISTVKNGCEIINMVRNLGSGDSAHLTLKAVSLRSAFSESASILEPMLLKKNIDLKTDFEGDPLISAEKSSLVNSVINNLLTNAVKFSYPGESISVAIREEPEGVRFTIEDRGIGMPADMVQSLFDPGRNFSRIGTEGERGTGFGMPLVRKFLTMYQASISISSREIDPHPHDHGTRADILFRKGGQPID
ncbi:MAG: hybrid sensor histidine kinase/response regulator [Spirochaetales bacterium]|nr:hybrid sensor histidine kinase/response regulator [Spirochaetales bacterium]